MKAPITIRPEEKTLPSYTPSLLARTFPRLPRVTLAEAVRPVPAWFFLLMAFALALSVMGPSCDDAEATPAARCAEACHGRMQNYSPFTGCTCQP